MINSMNRVLLVVYDVAGGNDDNAAQCQVSRRDVDVSKFEDEMLAIYLRAFSQSFLFQLEELINDPSRTSMLMDLALTDGRSMSLTSVPLTELTQVRSTTVSYTHLTLPTIYSV